MKKQKVVSVFVIICLGFLLSFSTGALTASAAKPIELKVATWNPPPPFPISATEVKWAKMVEEKSGGEVTFKFFWAGGLASLRDTYRAVQSGVAEIGFWLPGVLPGLHELNELPCCPCWVQTVWRRLPRCITRCARNFLNSTPNAKA